MLKVQVDETEVGSIVRSDLDAGVFYFTYAQLCDPKNEVSLTMPVVNDPYAFDYKHKLHPIFDMNLPEGDLGKRLRQQFGKVMPNFDDLTLLQIVGRSQIGRLKFRTPGDSLVDMPTQSVSDLLAHDGAEGLFDSLLERYAVYSGISGVQPKVLVRNNQTDISRVTHRDATHIVKAWHDAEYPQLAANEYFCLRAALHAGLSVPGVELSSNGKFLIVERFDIENGNYLGFEDFCVLNGKTSEQKYDGSYEGITKRIREFVSPQWVRTALESYFKTVVLCCVLKNGDAHLKNFGVLYKDTESPVRLSPVYDIVSTTPYHPQDCLALTLGGTKRWPKKAALIKFARSHCDLTDSRTLELMHEVAEGVNSAYQEMSNFMQGNEFFVEIGTTMQAEWGKGLALTLQAEFRFGNYSPVESPQVT
jgi:serine/threonine-protein kinase HipA